MRLIQRLALSGLAAATFLTACSPNRADESQQIAQDIRKLPGVEGTEYSQNSNPIVIFKEPTFRLTVRARRDVTGEQLNEVWKAFTRKVFDTGYQRYRVVLNVRLCKGYEQPCGTMSSDVDQANPSPPSPAWGDWLALARGGYAWEVDANTTSQGNDLRQRFMLNLTDPALTTGIGGVPKGFKPGQITATYRRVLKDFPQLRTASWSVAVNSPYTSPHLNITNGAPTEALLTLWDHLAAISLPGAAEFDMKPDATSDVRVTLSADEAKGRAEAVAQLKLLKEYGQPVKYAGTVASASPSTVYVVVNGCSDGSATGWEAELRQQFETCKR